MSEAPWTIDKFLTRLTSPVMPVLPAPAYTGDLTVGVCLAVESMRRHMTDEGWQLQAGIESAGYMLFGHNLPHAQTDVPQILALTNPGIVLVQDKREWDPSKPACWDKEAEFKQIGALAERPDIFKVTVLKDSHQQPGYHSHSAVEMGAHAWVVYYAPRIVKYLSPYVRTEHLIRTYHSVDSTIVPRYQSHRRFGALLSGAASAPYPLRKRLIKGFRMLPQTTHLAHPGYHAQGCATPDFLRRLSKYKVAICTASMYGYALRKIIEATACGCMVLTDLPVDEVLPEIDDNLIRVSPNASVTEVAAKLRKAYQQYNPAVQEEFAQRAQQYYDFKAAGQRLAADIENLRRRYTLRVEQEARRMAFNKPAAADSSNSAEVRALSRMVSPGMRRPTVKPFGGVLQIWVTRACDKACFGCTQGSNLGGKPGMMLPEQFEEAVLSLKDYFGVVGVFGGNPCISPHFARYCEILAKHIPFERRGLWSNNPLGHGQLCRKTFNPSVSNLNVHLDQQAYDEFKRDWPESRPFGLTDDSRHSPVYVAMQDVIADETERWSLIADCDINRYWSAMICVFRNQLRGFFCEIAGAQAMLHQHKPDYPDLGMPIRPGWWRRDMQAFAPQARFHCHGCGVPLRGYGDLAQGGQVEQVSATHADIYKTKQRDREVQIVTTREALGGQPLPKFTDYIKNNKL